MDYPPLKEPQTANNGLDLRRSPFSSASNSPQPCEDEKPLDFSAAHNDDQEQISRLQQLIQANSNALALRRKMQAAAFAANNAAAYPPPPQLPFPQTELQRVNHNSLAQYNHFRETMLRQFSLSKLKRRRRSISPTAAALVMSSIQSEHSCSSSLSPCSPASSSDASPPSSVDQASKRRRTDSSDGATKDEAYWERRKKNNEAAKRSRDARRAKEDEIAIRAAFLEQENVRLKWELATMKAEMGKMREMLAMKD